MVYNFLPLLRGASMCSGLRAGQQRSMRGVAVVASRGIGVDPCAVGLCRQSYRSRCEVTLLALRGFRRFASGRWPPQERPADQEFKTWGRHNRMHVAAGEL